jgi:hypothetical protein
MVRVVAALIKSKLIPSPSVCLRCAVGDFVSVWAVGTYHQSSATIIVCPLQVVSSIERGIYLEHTIFIGNHKSIDMDI